MSVLQAVALMLVAITGTLVALTREPVRQAIQAGFFGLALTILFFSFQAPDVALSQLVVSTVAIPVMILLAVAKVREHERRERRRGARGPERDR